MTCTAKHTISLFKHMQQNEKFQTSMVQLLQLQLVLPISGLPVTLSLSGRAHGQKCCFSSRLDCYFSSGLGPRRQSWVSGISWTAELEQDAEALHRNQPFNSSVKENGMFGVGSIYFALFVNIIEHITIVLYQKLKRYYQSNPK